MELIRINLLLKGKIKTAERKELVFLSIFVFLAVAFGGVYYYIDRMSALSEVEMRLTQAKLELAKHGAVVKEVEDIEALRRSLDARKNVINGLKDKGVVYPRFMEDFVSVIPAGISLKTLSVTDSPDGKISVKLSGEAVDNYSIADFITELMLKRYFTDIELGTITAVKTLTASSSSFSMTFNYQRKK